MMFRSPKLFYFIPVSISLIAIGYVMLAQNAQAPSAVLPGSESEQPEDSFEFFGNQAVGDLTGDGTPDIAFLLTKDPGGSGTFFYVMAVLKTPDGKQQSTNQVLLGDRIAPQTTEIRNGILIVNYAERKPGEPMTTQPSVGVSKYLKVENSQLVEVAKPTEFGEAVTLSINQNIVYSDGLQLSLKEINDSRCPADVQCIWQGELSALLVANAGNFSDGSKEVRLGTVNNTTLNLSGYSFELKSATTNTATVLISKQ